MVLKRTESDIAVQKDLAGKLEEAIRTYSAEKADLDKRSNRLIEEQNTRLKLMQNPSLAPEVKERLETEIDRLHRETDDLMEKATNVPQWDRAQLFLGTIELEHVPASMDRKAMLAEAIRGAKLIAPGTKELSSIGLIGSDMLSKIPGTADLVIKNTLSTMVEAGQLDYLREAGFVGQDKGWKLWIEVHYIRDRNPVPSGLHKDTLGQTLFVNLNYQNAGSILGPEYLMNPAPVAEHDEAVKGEGKLPEEFREDLGHVRRELKRSRTIKAPVIDDPYGAVAFVDEAIHHMTPVREHRSLTGAALGEFLKLKYGTKFADAEQAHKKYAGQWLTFWSFESYLESISKKDADKWFKLMKMVSEPKAELTRIELREAMDEGEIDEVLAEQGTEGFRSVSIPRVAGRKPVKHPEQSKPLRRQMSSRLLTGDTPEAPKLKRAFFRTWVRAVPSGQ